MTDQPPTSRATTAFDDDDYPAYTMGRAAEMLGVTPDFLRSLDAAGLLAPDRSTGGHRRYSRTELALAARVRELLDCGLTVLAAACRIAELERDLTTARLRITELDNTGSTARTEQTAQTPTPADQHAHETRHRQMFSPHSTLANPTGPQDTSPAER